MKRIPYVAAAAILVLLALAGARASGTETDAMGTVSPIVYPASDGFVRAAHAHPAHSRLRCDRCHQGATDSEDSSDILTPTEESCVGCHAAQITRDDASPERCGYCHEGYGTGRGRTGDRAVRLPQRSEPRIRFSHRLHAREGIRCLDCHEGVDEDHDAPGARHLPTMRSCHRCHGGISPSAPDACATCHVTLPDGRLRSRFPEGELDPPAWLFDMNHDRDFLVRHRWVGADNGDKCAACHEENDCTDCHDGRVRPVQRVHPNDYLTTHPQMARRDLPQCTSCHSTQNFCMECHARLGISSVSAPDVSSPSRYHPPQSVWVRGPNLHGREARRSMTTCVSCHAERDCIDCHGVAGIGAGISPHPSGFRAQCGRLLRHNPRACRSCHGDTAALAAACDM
jgi:hypothetical protein